MSVVSENLSTVNLANEKFPLFCILMFMCVRKRYMREIKGRKREVKNWSDRREEGGKSRRKR